MTLVPIDLESSGEFIFIRYHDFCNMGGERLTLQVEQTIRTLSKEGNSYSVIVKKLKAEGLDVGKATICRVVNGIGKKREAESNGQKFQVDRPRPVRTPATVSKVKRLATTENPPSQRQLSRMCGTSLKTINNIIHKDLELDTRRKGKVHKLTPFHMKNRATNARKLYEEHLAGSRSEYTATLDEAWMYVTYCNGIRKICYIKRGNQVPDNWVHQCSETFPKGFMVVGVMTGRGVLPLIKVPSKVKVNSEFYIECVLKPVIEQLKDLYPGEMDKVFLHHDKASSHTSNKTQQFLQEMKDTLGLNFIRNSDIPVKSPDASPLDFYGFGMLKQRLFNRRPKTEAGLWKAAQEEWSNVSLSKVKEVFAAWKVRCREIAKKKGKHIEHMKKIHEFNKTKQTYSKMEASTIEAVKGPASNQKAIRDPPCLLYSPQKIRSPGNHYIIEAWGEASSSERTTRRWFQKFKVGDFGLEDQDGRGRRSTFKNEDLKSHIESNNTLTVCEVSAELNASKSTIARHLYQIDKTKQLSQWIPHDLSDAQRQRRQEICSSLLARNNFTPFFKTNCYVR
ncbi:SETMAR [Cordylochernes scorpioides]|uniref:SETMAR n=1 Tax=Cordylochernes scorpioides TaxID=51811 RepID=A0ABY6JYA5_9ARAC|nr:SETMAR [Cordylochernes scorpioides]